MLLIPPYLIWMRIARPFIAFYNWCANVTLRAVGVQAKDELEIAVSTVELSEMIAESRSEGLLDPEEHMRLTRALRIRNRVVAESRCRWPRFTRCRSRGQVVDRQSGRSSGRWPKPAIPASR
jgi:CBS domain containing-hemolysin-like protein